jgi:hypothetical protein
MMTDIRYRMSDITSWSGALCHPMSDIGYLLIASINSD